MYPQRQAVTAARKPAYGYTAIINLGMVPKSILFAIFIGHYSKNQV